MMPSSVYGENETTAYILSRLHTYAAASGIGNLLGFVPKIERPFHFFHHELLRRLVCRMIGEWAEQGMIPNDPSLLSDLIVRSCYGNAKRYFKFE